MRKLKDLFTVMGTMVEYVTTEGFKRRVFKPFSQRYLHDRQNKIALGKKVAVTFSEEELTFSEQQRDYHFVLITYLAEHTGFTVKEMHDVVMKMKFGVKHLTYGGKTFEARESISDVSEMNMQMVNELILFDLELCAVENIVVPSKKELGYVEENERVDTKKIEELHKTIERPEGEIPF